MVAAHDVTSPFVVEMQGGVFWAPPHLPGQGNAVMLHARVDKHVFSTFMRLREGQREEEGTVRLHGVVNTHTWARQ